MKTTNLFSAASLLLTHTSAHYVFSRLIVNNTVSRDFQYVRDVTGNAGTRDSMWLKAFPIYGPENTNVTCGRGAFPVSNSASIETAVIAAGSEVGFMVSPPFFEGDLIQYIYHEGPGQIFMSKLPDGVESLNNYDGSGDFFKIGYAGPVSATAWELNDKLSMNATIPKTTPPGKYLLRIEQFLPSNLRGQSQWFVNCAHIEVIGSGGGSPGPIVKFPNAYKEDEPSVWFHEQGTEDGYPTDAMKYVEPKPAVWQG